MEILDLIDGTPGSNGQLDQGDFMNPRKLQRREKKPANATAAPSVEYQRGVDNLIRGLVDILPNANDIWSLDDRARWLRLAAGIFDLGYKEGDGEQKTISIVVSKPEPCSR
jgi:hypothetical protein